MYAAERLIAVIAEIRCSDRDIQMRLQGLRRELVQGVRDATPWRARNALDVIVMLDAPCWAALVALTDECPVLHAAIRASRRSLSFDQSLRLRIHFAAQPNHHRPRVHGVAGNEADPMMSVRMRV